MNLRFLSRASWKLHSQDVQFFLYAIGAAALVTLALNAERITTGLDHLLFSTTAEQLTLLSHHGDTSLMIKYSETINGTLVEYTATRGAGEDFDAFVARAAAEWEVIRKANGGA